MPTPSGPGSGPELVGRDAELRALLGVLTGAGSGVAATAVVRGEAGIGKTRLLTEVAERAERDGWRCLRVSCVQTEAVLPGAGLLTLLAPVRDGMPELPAVQATALEAALGWGPAVPGGDRFLLGAATLTLLAVAATRAPLLVLVDDVQWMDTESADALVFAARRLGHDRVAVLLAHRSGTVPPVPLADLGTVELAGLPATAARRLLGPACAAGVAARLVAETGGNALALVECRRVLPRAHLVGAVPLPAALPVPGRLGDLYADRLAALAPGAWRATLLCAASSGRAAAPVLAALTEEGLDPGDCLDRAEEVLLCRDGTLEFRHPLLRSAAWHRATAGERRSAHLSLAGVVGDRAERARHRAAATAGLDRALAAELASVAAADRDRLGFAAAASSWGRAATLTTEPGERDEWRAAAVEAAYVAGDTVRVRGTAADVLDSSAGPGPRARVLLALGKLEQVDGTTARARERFEQAVDLADGPLRLQALAELFLACHLLDDLPGMLAAAERAEAAVDPGDPAQEMTAAYLAGAARVASGRLDLGEPLLRRAIDLLESDPVLRDDPTLLVVSLLCVRWLMDPTPATAWVDRRVDLARSAGALGVLAEGLSMLAAGLAWIGDHVRAHACAGEAVELLEALGIRADPGGAHEVAALEAAYRGMHEEAGRLLDLARDRAATGGFDAMPPHLARVVAACALCRDDLSEVVAVLEDQVARFGGVGVYLEPLGVAPMLVEAYLGLGRREDAARLVEVYAAAQAEPPHPHVAAMVARGRGLVATDPGEAVEAFRRALDPGAGPPDRFEAARTRLLLGMRLRRDGRRVDARAHLEAARREFLAMEVTAWAERAAYELAGTGERSRSRQGTDEPLTSQETRVALLVARGRTNREVAAALFLSPRTVEHHLGAVLRKRGLRSRTELARMLAAGGEAWARGTGPWDR